MPRRAPAAPIAGQRWRGGSNPGGGAHALQQSGVQLQEWHPNQRPGLLELPSSLFAALATGGNAA